MKLSYYAFDFDDNILNMNTVIHLQYNDNGWIDKDVTTSEFREIRHLVNNSNIWRYRDDYDTTFSDFNCNDDTFLNDVMYAVDNHQFAPSWESFKECIKNGCIFAIITARGHEPSVIRDAIRWIIDIEFSICDKMEMVNSLRNYNLLFNNYTDNLSYNDVVEKYLDLCEFVGIGSEFYKKKLNLTHDSVETAKIKAINNFISRINMYSEDIDIDVNIGFSDDDIHTVTAVKNHINDVLKPKYHNIFFNIYHANNGETLKLEL